MWICCETSKYLSQNSTSFPWRQIWIWIRAAKCDWNRSQRGRQFSLVNQRSHSFKILFKGNSSWVRTRNSIWAHHHQPKFAFPSFWFSAVKCSRSVCIWWRGRRRHRRRLECGLRGRFLAKRWCSHVQACGYRSLFRCIGAHFWKAHTWTNGDRGTIHAGRFHKVCLLIHFFENFLLILT